MSGKNSRLVRLCKFDETVLDGLNSQVRCGLDFIRMANTNISGETKRGRFIATYYILESFLKCDLTSLSGVL
jgi:hypothetical protein